MIRIRQPVLLITLLVVTLAPGVFAALVVDVGNSPYIAGARHR